MHHRSKATGHVCWAVVLLCAMSETPSYATKPSCHLSAPAHAKAMLVLQCRFPNQGPVKAAGLSVSVDGETFERAGVGLPRPWNVFWSAHSSGGVATVLVPVGASFEPGREKFLFDTPGTYYLGCSAAFEEDGLGPGKVVHQLTVATAEPCDLNFLVGLSDPQLFGTLFPTLRNGVLDARRGEALTPSESDFLAVAVIGQLLEATRAREPGDVVRERGGIENALTWADTLLPLAKEFSESSYAPYAAYYAGCCYSAVGIGRAVDTVKARTVAGEPEGRLPEVEQMASLVQQDANYSKALDVFTFATERADAYLKPRVLYQKAFLHLNAGAYEEAEELFSSIERIAPDESMLQPQMDKLRAGIAEIKGLRRQRDSEKKGG